MTTIASPASWVENDVGGEGLEPQAPTAIVTPAAPEITPPPTQTPATPPATPVAPEAKTEPVTPPTPPVFNPKEIFGEEYGDVDAVKQEWERLKSVKGEYEKLRGEYEKSKAPEDPYLQSLTDWVRQGKDRKLHDLVYESNPENLTPQQKVALKLQIETGLTADEAMRLVEHQYKLGEGFDPEDADVQVAQISLKVAATEAHKYLDQFRAKASEPAPTFDYAAQVKSWEPHVTSTLGTLKEIPLSDDIKYPVSQETYNAALSHINAVLGTEGVQMDHRDPAQITAIKQMARDFIVARELDSILKYQRTEWEKQVIKKESNIPTATGEKPVVQATRADMLKNLPSHID